MHRMLSCLRICKASVEWQVLVNDYDAGKRVAFEQRIPNPREVYMSDGRNILADVTLHPFLQKQIC
ncbi:hypothetical protein ACS0TY_006339 [Phlomoides rotata]